MQKNCHRDHTTTSSHDKSISGRRPWLAAFEMNMAIADVFGDDFKEETLRIIAHHAPKR